MLAWLYLTSFWVICSDISRLLLQLAWRSLRWVPCHGTATRATPGLTLIYSDIAFACKSPKLNLVEAGNISCTDDHWCTIFGLMVYGDCNYSIYTYFLYQIECLQNIVVHIVVRLLFRSLFGCRTVVASGCEWPTEPWVGSFVSPEAFRPWWCSRVDRQHWSSSKRYAAAAAESESLPGAVVWCGSIESFFSLKQRAHATTTSLLCHVMIFECDIVPLIFYNCLISTLLNYDVKYYSQIQRLMS